MSAIDWLIVAAVNLLVIGYGWYLARGTRTSSEWFLARRALPWWAVGMSMFATNLDNADLVSIAGLTYDEGLHVLTVHTVGSVVGGVLAAFLLVPAIHRLRVYTNAEYLEARFGVSVRVLSALIQIQYRSSMLGLMTWSVYILLTSPLVGLESSAAWSVLVAMVILAAVYTAWGGLRSVVGTDALQAVVLFAAASVIVAAVWNAAGGWGEMTASLALIDAEHLPRVSGYRGDEGTTSPLLVAFGWIVIGGGYWTVNHTQTMRLAGCRSLWDMKMAALFGVALSMPVVIGCAALGLFGRALFPEFDKPDDIYPHLASLYLGPGLTGIVVAGMIAAAVSTFDSMGSALSAVFTRDVYARLFVRDRSDTHYVFVGRCATIGILALGFLYLPFIMAKEKMLDAYLTLIPVFVTPLFGLYLAGMFTKAHRRSGLPGLVAGSVYGVVALWDREVANLAFLPDWFTERWAAFAWSLFFTGIAMAAATILAKSAPEDASAPSASEWLARSRRDMAPPREHPFRDAVPLLLQPWIWATILVLVASSLVFVLLW